MTSGGVAAVVQWSLLSVSDWCHSVTGQSFRRWRHVHASPGCWCCFPSPSSDDLWPQWATPTSPKFTCQPKARYVLTCCHPTPLSV